MLGTAGLRSVCGAPLASRHHAQHSTLLCAAHNVRHQEATAASHAPANSEEPVSVQLGADSAERSGRRRLLSSSAVMAVLVASGGWASNAAAEDGANPFTGTDAPLTLAEPSGTKGFLEVEDELLAYKFIYPVESRSGRLVPIIFSRRPERYSSAAPLTADARQRIVCSLVSLADSITYTVTVGPAAGYLKDVPPAQWKDRDVAETVLIDRSTSRTTFGQRVSLNNIESIEQESRNGEAYWVYEHLTQGSPNTSDSSQETYRHAMAVTTVRPLPDGTPYLYTLNLSCREEAWTELQPQFQKAVDSFQLLKPGKKYVSPDQAPWRFF